MKRARWHSPTKSSERFELIVNISVITAALLFVFSVGWLILRQRTSPRTPRPSIAKGTKLTLPSWDWTLSPQTLVLVLSADCKYCTVSAPFYRRLVKRAALAPDTRLLAVLPQDANESREYLAQLEVKINDLQQTSPAAVRAGGTPTLILVNANGAVIQSWEGLLPPEAENEVLNLVK